MRARTKTPPKKTAAAKVGARKVAPEAAVETVAVHMREKTPRRRVTFEGIDSAGQTQVEESKPTAAAKRAALSGIIEAKKRRRKEEEEEVMAEDNNEDVDEEESEATNSDSGSEENLSDLADSDAMSDDSDEEVRENPFVKSKREGTRLSYEALRLRFLPPEFQEPQLFKFLSQFGAQVLNCFCVRSRRTHQSKGIAYVQFDDPAVLPTVVEECHGMSLGGRAVRAQVVTLHRAMPSKEKTTQRRNLAYAHKTRGAPLSRHDLSGKDPIAALIKYSRVEKANNEHLKRHGIDYEYCGFATQLANVPKEFFHKKRKNKEEKTQSSAHSNGQKKGKKGNAMASTVVSSSLSPTFVATKESEAKRVKEDDSEVLAESAPQPTASQTAAPSAKKRRTTTKKQVNKNGTREETH